MNKFLDGIKLGMGFIFIIGIFFGLVYATGFHDASEILGGVFNGNFEFNGALKLNNSNLSCDSSKEGSLKYNNSEVLVCNGINWSELSSSNLIEVGGIDSYTKLMLHLNGDLTDSSLLSHTVTLNGDLNFISGRISQAESFDGIDDYLVLEDSSDWDFGTGDWTIDAWIYYTGSDQFQIIWNTGGENSVDGIFFGLKDGNYYFQSHLTYVFTYSQDLRNAWHHIAAARFGNTVYNFIDGTLVGTLDVSGINMNNSYVPKIANGYGGAAAMFSQGYIDELRISKGIARWTSDFTPNTEAYN